GQRADVDAVVVDVHVESIEARIVELQVEDGVVGVQRAVAEDEPVHGGGAAELDGDGGAGLLAADGAEAGAGAHGQVTQFDQHATGVGRYGADGDRLASEYRESSFADQAHRQSGERRILEALIDAQRHQEVAVCKPD